MTTWVGATQGNTNYDSTSFVSQENGYVAFGYVADGYISGVSVWGVVPSASTVWTPA